VPGPFVVVAADIHLLLNFDCFHSVAYALVAMMMVVVVVKPLLKIKILNP
jgi:hypothetical protein